MIVTNNGQTLYLRVFTVILLIFGCSSEHNPFCNNKNQISNAYNLGPIIYITQGLTSIWKFDTRGVQFTNLKQTFSSIFGTDDFETVDSVFSFDFTACKGPQEKCADVESARNLVIVTGERKGFKSYGYVAYRFKPDYSLNDINKDWKHRWGLTAQGTFSSDFWPKSLRNNGTLVIGTGFARNERNLYLAVIEIDENKKPLDRLYTRNISPEGVWSEWKATQNEKINGMFTVRGNVYVVDKNSDIMSYQSSKSVSIDKKKMGSAQQFFNCAQNSTLLKYKDLPEERANDFSDNKDSGSNTTSSMELAVVANGTNVVQPSATDQTLANNGAEVPTTISPLETTAPTTGAGQMSANDWLIFAFFLTLFASKVKYI